MYPESSSWEECLGLYVEKVQVGVVRKDIVEKLVQFPDIFEVVKADSEGNEKPPGVYLSQYLLLPEDRTKALDHVMRVLRQQDELVALRGWRDEMYNVMRTFSGRPYFQVERAASSLIGVMTYGVHINGYTYSPDGKLMMWIGHRSKSKPTYPDMYDNMSAGGLTAGLSVMECALKECSEEAAVPDEHLKHLKQVGLVSCCYENEKGVFPENLFVFDLELPADFKPVNRDGEMDTFYLLPLDKVKELIIGDGFKPNCALVILDFFIRHGIITADSEPNYCLLVEQLHVPLQTIFSKFDKHQFCIPT
ncbi:hypothetical protein C0Q70_15306 [Pomacea canaliculata]|uniref:Nudix hydrolase domain-containing protein n=1 Tax=Pomacea canaliculata TaxID=400727 RepID=A0A2T7NUG7_POMCA|nr:hypothetical protein C0Q70_15306 [Pomacea canaliculata]